MNPLLIWPNPCYSTYGHCPHPVGDAVRMMSQQIVCCHCGQTTSLFHGGYVPFTIVWNPPPTTTFGSDNSGGKAP